MFFFQNVFCQRGASAHPSAPSTVSVGFRKNRRHAWSISGFIPTVPWSRGGANWKMAIHGCLENLNHTWTSELCKCIRQHFLCHAMLQDCTPCLVFFIETISAYREIPCPPVRSAPRNGQCGLIVNQQSNRWNHESKVCKKQSEALNDLPCQSCSIEFSFCSGQCRDRLARTAPNDN